MVLERYSIVSHQVEFSGYFPVLYDSFLLRTQSHGQRNQSFARMESHIVQQCARLDYCDMLKAKYTAKPGRQLSFK